MYIYIYVYSIYEHLASKPRCGRYVAKDVTRCVGELSEVMLAPPEGRQDDSEMTFMVKRRADRNQKENTTFCI